MPGDVVNLPRRNSEATAMRPDQIILAALAAGGADASYGPAQVQKLLFLIDREVPAFIGGPVFAFQPYDYGPFDQGVFRTLEVLERQGLARIDATGRYRRYSLTAEGFRQGAAILAQTAPIVQGYLPRVAQWVRSVDFSQLVSAIYNKFPDMKVNSIFRS